MAGSGFRFLRGGRERRGGGAFFWLGGARPPSAPPPFLRLPSPPFLLPHCLVRAPPRRAPFHRSSPRPGSRLVPWVLGRAGRPFYRLLLARFRFGPPRSQPCPNLLGGGGGAGLGGVVESRARGDCHSGGGGGGRKSAETRGGRGVASKGGRKEKRTRENRPEGCAQPKSKQKGEYCGAGERQSQLHGGMVPQGQRPAQRGNHPFGQGTRECKCKMCR